MPFKDDVWNTPAKQYQIAGVALDTSLALSRLADVLASIKAGEEITQDSIDRIRASSDTLMQQFTELSGHYNDG